MVPTDWTVYITFNIDSRAGEATVKSYVTYYTDSDIQNIETKWKPTTTTIIPSWEIKRQ